MYKRKDFNNNEEIEGIGGPIAEFLQSMFLNMMISLDEKIEPPISIVTYIQKQFTDMKRNISLIQTDQDRTGKVGSRVTRVDLISRYDDALNNFEMFSR